MKRPNATDQETSEASATPGGPGGTGADQPSGARRIGTEGDEVRVLNFASGGFDTVMQLGVIHALLVNQGKAPDAVVGISTGAANAVALAEVMQAGEELEAGWEEQEAKETGASSEGARRKARAARRELYARRRKARVARFRQILGEFYRSREDLVDALLPDAYQIESRDPLQPLGMPVFRKPERERRRESIANQSGLVKLYNDLLGVRLTVGTLTRCVRRLLGLSASHEVRDRPGRIVVSGLELLRLWILMGMCLFGVAPLVKILVLTFGPRLSPNKEGSTAGALIFRFWAITRVWRAAEHLFWFLAVLVIWGWFTLSLLQLPRQVSWLLGQVSWLPHCPWPAAYGLALLLLLALVAWGRRSLLEFDRTNWIGLGKSTVHGGAALMIMFVLWAGVLIAATFGGMLLTAKLRGVDDPLGTAAGWIVSFRPWFWTAPALRYAQVVTIAVGVALAVVVLTKQPGSKFLRRLLERYSIRSSIFHPYRLELFLSRVFDPGYFGQRDMTAVVDESLQDKTEASEPRWSPTSESSDGRKYLSRYSSPARKPAIHVGVGVADLETGAVGVVPEHHTVVDGLVASMASSPLLPPRKLGGRNYVDAGLVGSEPLQALFSLLRDPRDPRKDRLCETARIVRVYSVDSLPVSRRNLFKRRLPSRLSLVEVTLDALKLQRFRDATLERRLTELYTKVIPAKTKTGEPNVRQALEDRTYLRTWITPIEPDEPIELGRRIIRARKERMRQLIDQTIADGCRAAMQAMIGPSLGKRTSGTDEQSKDEIDCRKALKLHFEARRKLAEARGVRLGDLTSAEMPLAGDSPGPGLRDICKHCTLQRRQLPTNDQEACEEPEEEDARARRLVVRPSEWTGPAWPHELEPPTAEHAVDPPATTGGDMKSAPFHFDDWPRDIGDRDIPAPVERPMVNLLFSGGVFRGVFQLGVLSALSELRLRPDLIAGASVGSITAAMSAGVLTSDDPRERRERLCRLAAVYLALDRIVLSDRFADFIRNLTVRAADARFSIRQADRVLRRFDEVRAGRYGKEVRIVVAGLERLLYVSPFELERLVQAIRDRQVHAVAAQLREHGREWLERMGVGDELLGAEPLAMLIREYVLDQIEAAHCTPPAGASFASMRKQYGLAFLATATNLSTGNLELIGAEPEGAEARIDEGLLASSAFPAVFRPRDANEIYPGARDGDQFIDGGVMDNLPLDKVAQFLLRAAEEDRILKRPNLGSLGDVPHLVFAASLERKTRSPGPSGGPSSETWLESWPEVRKRVRELRYNRKLEKWANVQETLRTLIAAGEDADRILTPLDLAVVVAKPEWLCGTIAFHPMLGFRRKKQARSIAHGCASTLLRFAALQRDGNDSWLQGWGVSGKLPEATSFAEAERAPQRGGKPESPGKCWFRPCSDCPFSLAATQGLGLPETTRQELEQIHALCKEPTTHRPEV